MFSSSSSKDPLYHLFIQTPTAYGYEAVDQQWIWNKEKRYGSIMNWIQRTKIPTTVSTYPSSVIPPSRYDYHLCSYDTFPYRMNVSPKWVISLYKYLKQSPCISFQQWQEEYYGDYNIRSLRAHQTSWDEEVPPMNEEEEIVEQIRSS
jgi:hypothetical protein